MISADAVCPAQFALASVRVSITLPHRAGPYLDHVVNPHTIPNSSITSQCLLQEGNVVKQEESMHVARGKMRPRNWMNVRYGGLVDV